MPQAINLVLNNGATNPVAKTFELISPAAGDGGIATWALKEGVISSVFPLLTAAAAKTNNASRKLAVKFRLPSSYTESVTGRTVVGSAAEMNVTFSIPGDFPEALKADFVAFATNALKTELFQKMIRDAVNAT